MKNRKGITLITIVVTLVILLIIASVGMNMVIKKDSPVESSKNAKEKTIENIIQGAIHQNENQRQILALKQGKEDFDILKECNNIYRILKDAKLVTSMRKDSQNFPIVKLEGYNREIDIKHHYEEYLSTVER